VLVTVPKSKSASASNSTSETDPYSISYFSGLGP
jgi:hypothetical protein